MSYARYAEQAAHVEALRATFGPALVDAAIELSRTSMLSFDEAMSWALTHYHANDEAPRQPEG